MGKKINWEKWIAVLAIVFIIISFLLSQLNFLRLQCDTIEEIDASLTVKVLPERLLLGFNADKNNLKFGSVSPGIAAKRKVYAQYSKDVAVQVFMKGDLAPWTVIEPSLFNLSGKEIKEVFFEVLVPLNAAEGDYTGKAMFCFTEKK